MIKHVSIWVSTACILIGCSSTMLNYDHTATITVVDAAGRGVPGLRLYAVYPTSSRLIEGCTAADGAAVLRFPVLNTAQRSISISIRGEQVIVGDFVVRFADGRTNVTGKAEIGYHTELGPDGSLVQKQRVTPFKGLPWKTR